MGTGLAATHMVTRKRLALKFLKGPRIFGRSFGNVFTRSARSERVSHPTSSR